VMKGDVVGDKVTSRDKGGGRIQGGEDSQLDEAPDGKWALKNHAKWKVRLETAMLSWMETDLFAGEQTTPPCSELIGATASLGGILVCKTFRQDDSEHSPKCFKVNEAVCCRCLASGCHCCPACRCCRACR